ncbi:MAG: hypothetical protein AB8C46_17175 [Burkholderiaceae bacterium]
MPNDKIEIENVNVPGQVSRVDALKYADMKQAMLRVLPNKSPGLTGTEIVAQVKPHLPEATFPGGKTSGWWAKTVQLDLEAKGLLVRTQTSPLRWHRAKP